MLDPLTGGLICKYEIRAEGQLDYGNSPRATPIIGAETIYLQSAFGQLVALDPFENKVVWSKHYGKDFLGEMPTWGYCSSPLLLGDSLIVQPGGKLASVVSLDAKTGDVRWRASDHAAAYASPVASARHPIAESQAAALSPVVIATGAKSIRGLDIDSGTLVWEIKPETSGDFMVPTPIVNRSRLFLTGENNGARVYDLVSKSKEDALTLPLIAKSDRLSGDTHSPIVVGGFLIGVDQDLVALEIDDHLREASSFSDAALDQYAPILCEGNHLLVCCSNGSILGIRVESDGTLAEYSRTVSSKESAPMLAHPALVDGLLYVRHSNRVSAYRLDLDTP